MLIRRTALVLCSLLVAGCAGASPGLVISTTGPNNAAENIPASLARPAGPGPFPAIVILHDCSGLGPKSGGAPARWARDLVFEGYVVLMPDSFTTRGFADGVCTEASPARNAVAPVHRVRDAYAALAYLRTLPYVDGTRVGVMGGSHGGSTTLAAMVAPESDAEPLAQERRRGFAAGAALYPGCAMRLGDWRGAGTGVYRPVGAVLILAGEKDDWTPAEPCRKLVEAAQGVRYPVTIKVYPGAHHAFDNASPVRYVADRVNGSSPTGRGATTGGNPAAWDDSIRQIRAFFAQHLAQR
jgi:dienelactone hydrolase